MNTICLKNSAGNISEMKGRYSGNSAGANPEHNLTDRVDLSSMAVSSRDSKKNRTGGVPRRQVPIRPKDKKDLAYYMCRVIDIFIDAYDGWKARKTA